MKRKTSIHPLMAAILGSATLLFVAGCEREVEDVTEMEKPPPRAEVPVPVPAPIEAGPAEGAVPGEATPGERQEAGYVISTLSIPVAGKAGLEVERRAPDQVRVGESYAFDITVRNVSEFPLHDVVVREVYQGGLHAAEGQPQELAVGNLGPGEAKKVSGAVRAGEEGEGKVCMVVDYNRALCTAVKIVKPELALQRFIINAEGELVETAYACDEVLLVYELTNPGSAPTSEVTIMEDLPEGFLFNDKQEIRIAAGQLNPGEKKQYRVPLTIQQPASYNGFAIAKTDKLTVESLRAPLEVVQPVLAVNLEGPREQYTDRFINYTATVTNTSKVAARNTVLRLTLPEGAEEMSISSQLYDPDLAAIEIGLLNPGESRAVDLGFFMPAEAQVKVAASAEAYCAQPRRAEVATVIRGIPALQIAVVDEQDPLRPGQQTTYLLTVVNEGTAEATGIKLTGQLPPGMTFLGARGPATITAEGRTLTFGSVPDLAPGQVAEYEIAVRADQPGTGIFRVNLDSSFLPTAVQAMEPTTVVDSLAAG